MIRIARVALLASFLCGSVVAWGTERERLGNRHGLAMRDAVRGMMRGSSGMAQPNDSMDFSGSTGFMDKYVNSLNTSVLEGGSQDLGNTTAELLEPRRQLVVARYDEDINWTQRLPKNFDIIVYQSHDRSTPNFVDNFGNEASKYLTYIVDHFDDLPDSVTFVQAGRQDWHDPFPKEVSLRKWNWGAAADHGGLAYLPTSAPCLIEDSVALSLSVVSDGKSAEIPDEAQCTFGISEHEPPQMEAVKDAWPSVFEPELGPLPQRWLAHCCAQFEVTRDAIRQHPIDFYRGLLSWTMNHDRELAETDYGDEMKRNHDPQRRDAGHVLEVLWVLLFSESRSVLPDKVVPQASA